MMFRGLTMGPNWKPVLETQCRDAFVATADTTQSVIIFSDYGFVNI